MSGILTASEQVAALIRAGVPREKARAHALGYPGAVLAEVRAFPAASVQPITLRLPWSCLVSDNAKSRAAKKGDSATIVLTPEYRDATKRIGQLATDVMAGRPAWDEPLKLEAFVWVPDNRIHDVCNFSKAVHDALKGTVFTDDRWLYDTRWVRAGVDVDAPRAELSIRPLTPAVPTHA